jgi:hypothetical protein
MADEPSSIQSHIDAMDQASARMDERIQRLAPFSDRIEKDPKAPAKPVECPLCSAELELGRVTVHGTFWGFLFVGFSYQNCWFEPADGSPEIIAVDSCGARHGFRCRQCGFIGIRPVDAGLAWRRPRNEAE